ncbi:MAG: hypothetical protein EBU51_01010 [Synechococcaceae bacterium WB6_3A_227]|nr:hypothetical protein [Synechococcaceae bacterium WB6_3A_227]
MLFQLEEVLSLQAQLEQQHTLLNLLLEHKQLVLWVYKQFHILQVAIDHQDIGQGNILRFLVLTIQVCFFQFELLEIFLQ